MLKTWIIATLIANLSLTESVHIQKKDHKKDPQVEELISQLESNRKVDAAYSQMAYSYGAGVEMSQKDPHKKGKKKHHKKKGKHLHKQHHVPADSKDLMVEENHDKV